jgi:hypothetical protein
MNHSPPRFGPTPAACTGDLIGLVLQFSDPFTMPAGSETSSIAPAIGNCPSTNCSTVKPGGISAMISGCSA